jgi:hypothetical protein
MSYELFVPTNGLLGARRAKNVPFAILQKAFYTSPCVVV